MKKILLLIIFVFSLTANAEEIIMVCTHHNYGERILKYTETVGVKKVTIRREGGVWKNWERSDGSYKKSLLTINDKGAILKTFTISQLENSNEEAGVTNNQDLLWIRKYVVDFEFLKRTVSTHITYLDGSTIKRGLKGYDPKIPWVLIWNCEKHNND